MNASCHLAIVLRLGGAGAALMLHLLLAWALGTIGYGQYVFVLSWVTVLVIPALWGMEHATARFAAELLEIDDRAAAGEFYRTSTRRVVLSSAIVAAAMAAAATLIAPSAGLARACLVGAALTPLVALLRLREAMWRVLGRAVWGMTTVWLTPVALGSLVAGSAWLAPNWLTAPRAVAMQVVVIASVLGVSHFVQRSCLPAELVQVQNMTAGATFAQAARLRQWRTTATPLMALAALQSLQYAAGPIAATHWLGSSAAAVFSAAIRLAATLHLVTNALNVMMAPQFASLHARGDRVGLEAAARSAAKTSSLFVAALGSGLLIFADQFLRLFGADYVAGRPAMSILVCAIALQTICGPSDYLLSMTGRHQDCLRQTAWVVGILLFTLAAAIPAWGLNGGATAVGAAIAVLNVRLSQLVRNEMQISCALWQRPIHAAPAARSETPIGNVATNALDAPPRRQAS